MGELKHTHQQMEDGPLESEQTAPGEHLEQTDAKAGDEDRIDLDPDEQVNRPDQPDFDPREREPFVDERAIADADRPEDR